MAGKKKTASKKSKKKRSRSTGKKAAPKKAAKAKPVFKKDTYVVAKTKTKPDFFKVYRVRLLIGMSCSDIFIS